ncbi:RSP_7527 family protein [uncultured Amphritea sp.]|uniref:RSP_7527 family protein n=1 Tax=uncultured Amphritea sp. TaxID=981605 RepID=UPI0026155CF6|nr:hypothetical protein [uncultured Amphritea sp.]
MSKHLYGQESTDYDLNEVIAEADRMRAEYLQEFFSNIAKKLTNLLSAELPEFIRSPLAHR